MQNVKKALASLIALSVLVYVFIGYFVTGTSDAGHVDGWGRELSEAPFLVRLLLIDYDLWPGAAWFLIDGLIFFGGLFLAFVTFSSSLEK